jgi:hypothetical protein
MTFAQPWWLLLLPLWPLLLLLVRASDRRTPRPAPDFLLWQRAAARLPRAASRARLSLRDLVWIAPLFLITLGLARPELRPASAAEQVLVLVDRSASMATVDGAGATRLARGLAEARRLLGSRPHRVEGIPPGGRGDEASPATVEAGALVESAVAAHAAGMPVLVVTDLALELPNGVGLVQIAEGARNAGITSAGFDPDAGLLVRVEGDPGAGRRTLTAKTADGALLLEQALDEQPSARIVIPASQVASASSMGVRLDPPDANPLDDVVTLTASGRALTAALERSSSSIERALRACPGVTVVSGPDPAADLVVGARPRQGGFALLLPPIENVEGFETGAVAEIEGPMSGNGTFAGLVGPTRWPAVFRLAKAPAGTERLLEAGGVPLLVRHEKTFALLVDAERSGWESVPSFPLAIARIVELAGAGAKARFEPRGAVLSAAETLRSPGDPVPARAPAPSTAPANAVPVAPWCHALALVAMIALLLPRITSRRAGATSRTRPASAPVAEPHRTARS